MGTLTARDDFQDVVYWNTSETQTEDRLWKNKVMLYFTDGSGTLLPMKPHQVYLERLRACQTEQGYGSEAMKWIIETADELKVDIFLHACPDTPDPQLTQRLFRFYRQFDFQRLNGNLLFRRAEVIQPIRGFRNLSLGQPIHRSGRKEALRATP